MKNNNLKQKILNFNSYSIIFIVLIFSILTFISVYFILNSSFNKEKEFTKNEYLFSQKLIIKNQVNNFINFIKHTKKIVKEEETQNLIKNVKEMSELLSITSPTKFSKIILVVKKKDGLFQFGLSDIKGNKIFTTAKDYTKQRRSKLIQKGFNKLDIHKTEKGIKYSYILKFRNKIDNKLYVIGSATYEKNIDDKVKKIVLDRINSIKFGAKNNGYLSIAEILNYKGGKGFAKVVALPVKPAWVGKLLDEDKKDAKGKKYRKEYLKIANTTKEGFVSYWFFKKNTKKLRPKLSYVKLYSPYNWLIFTSVYVDDINSVLTQKEEVTKKEIKQIFIIYTFLSILFLIIAYLISKYENKILQKIIDEYEKVLHHKNNELSHINKNLEKEVETKTQKLLDVLLKDTLTNLPNREKLLLDIKNKDNYIGILNIDSFKEINDFYGLEVGDVVLQKVANIIKNSISERCYRLSGDEFAVIDENIKDLENNLENLVYVLSNTSIKINDNLNISFSMSCGIGETFTKADMALKYAKKSTQKVVIFDENLKIVKEYENNIKWKRIIHNAIKTDNIIPFVQPIINNKTGVVEKYECLVRLKDNDKIYTPYFFLDISKHTHQYHDIQKIMVKKTFEKFSILKYKFSINLSTLDLLNNSFRKFLLLQIEKYDIKNKLIIELLEDEELMQKDILEFIHLLKSKNIQIAIDDFGSGYSNFSYLIKDIPVNILKIDGSIVRNISQNEKDYRVFKSIVMMAKEFNFQIVAEFVENKEIFEILKELEVNYSQGYYFSEPFDMTMLES